MSDNYDQLSPLGEDQARVLGRYWARLGLRFDRVYIGPRVRHEQTTVALASTYQNLELPWPEPELLPEFDEHQGIEVMQQVLPEVTQQDSEIKALAPAMAGSGSARRTAHLKIFKRIMQLWVRGALNTNGLETWADFRHRVQTGLDKITTANGGGKTIAVFTSTGPVAVAVGQAFSLRDEQILELTWPVRNGSYTEFRFSGEQFSLSAFNSTAHFQSADMLTYV